MKQSTGQWRFLPQTQTIVGSIIADIPFVNGSFYQINVAIRIAFDKPYLKKSRWIFGENCVSPSLLLIFIVAVVAAIVIAITSRNVNLTGFSSRKFD
jgi:hypothetical protein